MPVSLLVGDAETLANQEHPWNMVQHQILHGRFGRKMMPPKKSVKC